MQNTLIHIGLSNQAIESFDRVIRVLWFLYLPILLKFFVQLATATTATTWFGLVGLVTRTFPNKKTSPTDKPIPKVAVIVPAYNEEVGIVKTIRSIVNNDYGNIQLIVVNDGSTDATHEKVTDFIQSHVDPESQHQVPIQYLKLPNGGKAKAMNQAFRTLDDNVDIVMTVDADSMVHHEAIGEIVKTFQNRPKVAAVAGNVVVANRSTVLGKIQQAEYLSGFFCKRGDSVFGAVYIIGGAAAAYRKTVLDSVGGFDDSVITEDIELSTRILKHNYATAYAHNAVVYTEGPSDWKGLANQRLRWKYGRILTFLKHRSIFFSLKNWNVYLCWFLLPATLYAEMVLLLEPVMLSFFLFYLLFLNVETFIFVLALLDGLTLLQIAVDRQRSFHRNLLPWALLSWVAALVIEVVEWMALMRSVRRLFTGQRLEWQKWKRVGIDDPQETDSEVDTDNTDDDDDQDKSQEVGLEQQQE